MKVFLYLYCHFYRFVHKKCNGCLMCECRYGYSGPGGDVFPGTFICRFSGKNLWWLYES